MQRYIASLLVAVCLATVPVLSGCDREVAKKEEVHTNPNGTVTKEQEKVTHNDATGDTTVTKDKTTH